MKQFYTLPAALSILVLCLYACNKRSGGDTPTPDPPKQEPVKLVSFSTGTQIHYDGVAYDSTRTISWKLSGTISSVTLNGVSVAAAGSITTGMLRTDTTFRLNATGPLGAMPEESRTIQVTYDPTVLKLCVPEGWKLIRQQQLDNGVWLDHSLAACMLDDRHQFYPNRRTVIDFRNRCNPGDPSIAWSDTGYCFINPAKTAFRWGNDWDIPELTSTTLVIEGNVPHGFSGTEFRRIRRTYARYY